MKNGLSQQAPLNAAEVGAWLRVARIVATETGEPFVGLIACADGTPRDRAAVSLASWAVGGAGISPATSAQAVAVLELIFDRKD